MYTYICIYIYIFIYIYVYVCMYMQIYIYMYIHIYMYIYFHICMQKDIYLYIHTYAYAYIQTCIYTPQSGGESSKTQLGDVCYFRPSSWYNPVMIFLSASLSIYLLNVNICLHKCMYTYICIYSMYVYKCIFESTHIK